MDSLKTKRGIVGKNGETEACKYLIKMGYKILIRNYREKFDEIDVIARDKDSTLVFIEVKALEIGSGGLLKPEDNFTKQKAKKVKRACSLFVQKNNRFLDNRRGWRIDLLCVEFFKSGDKKIGIRHYKNIE